MIVGGWFFTLNGIPRNHIARLNSNGSLDTTFNQGAGANSGVHTLSLQSDGSVLLGGNFTTINGIVRNRIARLNVDGSLDTTFSPVLGANSLIRSLILQQDGKVLIGGDFTTFNGITTNHIVRLNANASIDTTFNIGNGSNSPIYALSIQPNGKILISGKFTSYNNISMNQIARLNVNGSIDLAFNPGMGVATSFPNIEAISSLPDGRVLIGGVFTYISNASNGFERNGIARLNINGTLDKSFNQGSGANYLVRSIALQNGKVLIGGDFTTYNNSSLRGIARLHSDGSIDTTLNLGTGFDNVVMCIETQPDGKLLVGGIFNSYNGISRNRIARLNPNGSVDSSFNPGTGPNGYVHSIFYQQDGKVLIGGEFTMYNNISRNNIARLNVDGSLDLSFNPGTGANSRVEIITQQQDGKMIIVWMVHEL